MEQRRPNLLSFYRAQVEEAIEYSVDRLVFGTAILDDECTIEESGITEEKTVIAFMDLEGGKRKRKKKVYTKPKKIGHKHAKRPMAALQYYVVEANGKIKKLKHECTTCPVGKLVLFVHTYRHLHGRPPGQTHVRQVQQHVLQTQGRR
jgi:small subunit ribosomal protein S27Ae